MSESLERDLLQNEKTFCFRDNTPYFADEEMRDALRLEMQEVNPEDYLRFQAVWFKTAGAFLLRYGGYLTTSQVHNFIRMPIIVSQDTIWEISESWFVETPDESLNGIVYEEYTVGEDDDVEDDDEICDAACYYSGGFSLIKKPSALQQLDDTDLHPKKVNVDYLIPQREFENLFEIGPKKLRDTLDWETFVGTAEWAKAALHEKIHELQDPILAYPIAECSVDYYVRKVFAKNGWYFVDDEGREKARKYWRKLVKRHGNNIHSYIFDNAPSLDIKKSVHRILRSSFTPKRIRKIFPTAKWKTRKATAAELTHEQWLMSS